MPPLACRQTRTSSARILHHSLRGCSEAASWEEGDSEEPEEAVAAVARAVAVTTARAEAAKAVGARVAAPQVG